MADLEQQQAILNSIQETLKANNRLYRDAVRFNDEVQKKILEQKDAAEALSNKQKEWAEENASESRKYLETLELISDTSKKNLEQNRSALKAFQEMNNQLDVRLEQAEKLGKKGKKQKELIISQKEENEKIIETLQKQNKLLEAQNKQNQRRTRGAKRVSDAFDGIVGKLGMTSEYSKTWLSDTIDIFNSVGGIRGSFSVIGTKLKDFLQPSNIFANLMEKVASSSLEMAFNMDRVFADFARATGTGADYQQQINQIRTEQLDLGIGFDRSAEAMRSLVSTMNDFNTLSPIVQNELAMSAARLERLGISTESTAETLNTLTNSFQMSAREAIRTQERVAALATQLGVPPQEMAKDYRSALPQLAQFGTRATEIFEGLAAQAKATGIAVNELVGFVDKFDTFEQAAETTGKLNAMLGGNLLNSIDLLTAEGPERLDLIRQALDQSGQSFAELDRFAQKSIASIVGLPVDKARAMFETTNQEIMNARNAANSSSAAIANLNKKIQAATSFQDKWRLATEAFAVAAMPLLQILTNIVQTIVSFNDTLGGYLVPTILGAATAIFALQGALSVYTVAQNIATAAAAAFGITAGAALGPILAIGTAVAAIGAAVWWAVGGFEKINKEAQETEVPRMPDGTRMPGFADGVTDFKGGAAIVGEKGPEVVSLPGGSNVVTNENIEKLYQTTKVLESVQAKKQQQQIAAGAGSTTSNRGSSKEVVLQLNERELGRAVVDLLNNELDLSILGA